MLEYAKELENLAEYFAAPFVLWAYYFAKADHDIALEYAGQVIDLAQKTPISEIVFIIGENSWLLPTA